MAPTSAGTASMTAGGPHAEDRGAYCRPSHELGSRTYLPLAMRSATVADLPLPATSAPPVAASVTPTATATASPTQRASVTQAVTATASETETAAPTPTSTPAVCTASLEDRLLKVAVPIERPAAQPPPTPQNGFDVSRPVLVAVRDDGAAYVGWSSTDQRVHVTPIRLNGQRLGPDTIVKGQSIHGLAATGDGAGLLVARDYNMVLARIDAQGNVLYENAVVGPGAPAYGASKMVNKWGHEGRLIWWDGHFAARFGHTDSATGGGTHQGDLQWYFDEDGTRIAGTSIGQDDFSWGCSHSLDVRLAYNAEANTVGSVCLSDSLPWNGIAYLLRFLVSDEPSGDGMGYSDARLGDLVPLGGDFMLVYASPVVRKPRDVKLVRIHLADFRIDGPHHLTNTSGIGEEAPHLARYGPNLLAGWTADDKYLIAVVSPSGAILEGPVAIDAQFAGWDDFVSMPNGDVVWAYTTTSGRKMWLALVPYCEPAPGGR